MFNQPTSYLSPKLEGRARPEVGGWGVFARKFIRAGELLTVWGGEVVSLEQFLRLPEHIQRLGVQVEEDLFLVSTRPGPADYINHSCNPNAGLSGQVALVALRDILPGEEVCYDYAMSDGTPVDEFDCLCGSLNCRGRVTGQDWSRPELWERYGNHFSPYLLRRIERIKKAQEIFQAAHVHV